MIAGIQSIGAHFEVFTFVSILGLKDLTIWIFFAAKDRVKRRDDGFVGAVRTEQARPKAKDLCLDATHCKRGTMGDQDFA